MATATGDIRNLALLGHAGAGKTLLAEALLFGAGAIRAKGSLARGTTVCDHDPQARRLQHSVDASLCWLETGRARVTLVDTPGYPDFIGRTLPVLEAVRGVDTVRVPWPLQITLLDTMPLVAQLEDDPGAPGPRDLITVGRAAPNATYDWFFPAGTRAVVSGRINDDVRLALAPGQDVWVPAAEARLLPLGTPVPRARAKAITLHARRPSGR